MYSSMPTPWRSGTAAALPKEGISCGSLDESGSNQSCLQKSNNASQVLEIFWQFRNEGCDLHSQFVMSWSSCPVLRLFSIGVKECSA